jgi:hypothetical protein
MRRLPEQCVMFFAALRSVTYYSSQPAPTPAHENIASLKKRLSALEDNVRDLKK